MSDQVPSSAPPGFKWTRSLLGLGPWQLVEDQEYPLPPQGYRYQPNFLTGKPELVPTIGRGIDWYSDGNSRPKPAPLGASSRQYSYAVPDPAKIGRGIEFVGPQSNDPPVDKKLAKDSPHQVSNRDTAAIF